MFIYYRQYQCPLLPPDQRPKRPKKNTDNSILSCSSSGIDRLLCDVEKNNSLRNSRSKDSFTSRQTNPKGLFDGLSQFFTPTDKRKSRVSLQSRTFIPVIPKKTNNRHRKTDNSKQNQSHSRKTAFKLIKKSRLMCVKKDKEQKKPENNGQRKCLFDGLSHLYTAQGHRKKDIPLYSLAYRRFKKITPQTVKESPSSENHEYCEGRAEVEVSGMGGRDEGLLLSDSRSQIAAGKQRGHGLRRGNTAIAAEGKTPTHFLSMYNIYSVLLSLNAIAY